MKKVHTSIRLKQIMKERNLKQVDILRLTKPISDEYGERLGKNDLSQYVSGKTEPGQKKLFVLGKALGVNPTWLLGLDVSKEFEESNVAECRHPNKDIGIPYNPIIHKIPILGRVSAGLPLYADENIEGYTYTEHNGGAEYFALRVKGDSMNAAHIDNGSTLIVRRQPEVENGEIAVVRVNKEDATVKRFRQDEDFVQLIPQSFNPEHQIQIYDLKTTDIEIIGKVVESKTEF